MKYIQFCIIYPQRLVIEVLGSLRGLVHRGDAVFPGLQQAGTTDETELLMYVSILQQTGSSHKR